MSSSADVPPFFAGPLPNQTTLGVAALVLNKKGRLFERPSFRCMRVRLQMRAEGDAVGARVFLERVGVQAGRRAGEIFAGDVGMVEGVLDEPLNVPAVVRSVEREQQVHRIPRADAVRRILPDAAPGVRLPV